MEPQLCMGAVTCISILKKFSNDSENLSKPIAFFKTFKRTERQMRLVTTYYAVYSVHVDRSPNYPSDPSFFVSVIHLPFKAGNALLSS